MPRPRNGDDLTGADTNHHRCHLQIALRDTLLLFQCRYTAINRILEFFLRLGIKTGEYTQTLRA